MSRLTWRPVRRLPWPSGAWSRFSLSAVVVVIAGALLPQGLVLPGPVIDPDLPRTEFSARWNAAVVESQSTQFLIVGWRKTNDEYTAVFSQVEESDLTLSVKTRWDGDIFMIKGRFAGTVSFYSAPYFTYAAIEHLTLEEAVSDVLAGLFQGVDQLQESVDYTTTTDIASYRFRIVSATELAATFIVSIFQ